MKKINECPICNHTSFKPFLKTKDFMITQEEFTIVECENCGFHFTNPAPEESKVDKYYQDEAYISHSSSKKGIINWIYNKVREVTLNQKLGWIKKHSEGNNLLDIGCGTGHFLSKVEKNGYSVTGLEPDPIARENAAALNGVHPLDIASLKSLEKQSYDVITMWHVLEHVYELKESVETYLNLLKPNGTLFIAVPNLESWDAQHYKEYWAAYDVPRHLYHFRKKDIENLFKEQNFEVSTTLPMKFDSYYVSMLSEKYKKGSLLSAVWNGFKSNRKAKKFGYSSQVYVIKRK